MYKRQHLYVDFIDRTGAHINLARIDRQHKRRLDAADIQQFIRRLRRKHRRTVNIARTLCDRILFPVYFRHSYRAKAEAVRMAEVYRKEYAIAELSLIHI